MPFSSEASPHTDEPRLRQPRFIAPSGEAPEIGACAAGRRAGARLEPACEALGISPRNLQRLVVAKGHIEVPMQAVFDPQLATHRAGKASGVPNRLSFVSCG
jgi:hypothetical protein